MKTRTQIGPRWAAVDWSVDLIDGRRVTASQLREAQGAMLVKSLVTFKAIGALTEENHDAALRATTVDSFAFAAREVVGEN